MSKPIRETLDFGASQARIINLPSPQNASDAATKAYVDALPAGLAFIEKPVRAASTGNININSPGAQIDGVALNTNDRVLLWQQTTASQNGIYVFASGTSALTRSTDTFVSGSVVFTTSDGSTNNNIGFILTTSGSITVGTTNLTFVPGFRIIAAGTGLQMSGNVISLTAPVSIALGGTGATTAAGALAALGAAIPNSQTFGDGATSTFVFSTFKSIIPRPIVQIVNASTGVIEDATVTITPGTPSNGVYSPNISVTAENWVASPPASNAYIISVVG